MKGPISTVLSSELQGTQLNTIDPLTYSFTLGQRCNDLGSDMSQFGGQSSEI